MLLGWSCNLVSSYRFIACTYKYSDWTYDPTANAVLQRQTQHPTANVPSQRQTYSPTANATSANFSPQNVFYQHHSGYAKESYHDAWLHGFALGDVCVLDQSIPTHLNPGLRYLNPGLRWVGWFFGRLISFVHMRPAILILLAIFILLLAAKS